MAYADTIRTASADMEDVADLIDGLIIDDQQVTSNGVISIATATPTLYTGSSITVTTGTDDVVMLTAHMACSVGNTATRVDMFFRENAATSTIAGVYRDATTSTAGDRGSIATSKIYTPSTGSNTYSIYWASTTAATIYSLNLRFQVIVFQG